MVPRHLAALVFAPNRALDLPAWEINQITFPSRPACGLYGGNQNSTKLPGGDMDRPRAADDFATIRARMEELRREQEGAEDAKEPKVPGQIPVRANRIGKSRLR